MKSAYFSKSYCKGFETKNGVQNGFKISMKKRRPFRPKPNHCWSKRRKRISWFWICTIKDRHNFLIQTKSSQNCQTSSSFRKQKKHTNNTNKNKKNHLRTWSIFCGLFGGWVKMDSFQGLLVTSNSWDVLLVLRINGCPFTPIPAPSKGCQLDPNKWWIDTRE